MMDIFIIFLLLISLNIGISFENILDTSDSTEEPLLWSRLKDINPPTTKISFTKFKPKYIFKGLKERISSDLDDGFVNNETPLNLWSSGNISFKNEINSESNTEIYPLNHKIDEKFFWNISDITNDNDENSSYSDRESDNKTLNESEIIFSSSELNPISKINTSTEQNLNLNTVQNTKAILLSPKESELGQNFPIYFTNPATGIVYAIHPVGTSSSSSSSSTPNSQNLQMGSSGHPYTIENFTSQMYVTKEEYERKIHLLKERFRHECNQLRRRIQEHNRRFKTAVTTTTTTTEAPKKFEQKKKIIKHKDPLIVEALDGVLSDVYDQVVDTMTLKVKKSKKKRKNGSIRNKSKKKKKDQNITTTSATDKIDDDNDDHEPIVIPVEEKPPEPFIHIWNEPSTSSTTSTPLNLIHHNDYNDYDENDGDDDDKRYTLISSSRPNKKQKFEIQSYSKPVQMSYEQNYESLIPIRLTKRTKRSLDSINNSQSIQNSLKVNSLNKTETKNNQKNIQNLNEPQNIQNGSTQSIASSPKTTPTPQYSKKTSQHDDYYFDFDDLIYDDYEYPDENSNQQFVETQTEQRNAPSRKNGKKPKDILPAKKRKRKNTRGEDYAYFDDPGIFSYIEDFVSTIQNTVSSFLPDASELSSLNNDLVAAMVNKNNEKSKFPKPSADDENVSEDQNKNPTEDNTGIGSWFSSWFGSGDEPENIENQITETTEEPGWFESIFGTEEKSSDVSTESEDDSGQWLFGWFDSDTKKKKQKKKTVTTTPTPILTVTDQMINPQKWIGILAQHIVNSNASQTENSNEANLENDVSKKMSYDKYQVWRLKLHKESQLKALERYKSSSEGNKIQWLMGPSLRGLTDVAVPPKLLSNFQAFLKSETIAYEVLIFDFGKAILYEDSKDKLAPKLKRSNSLSWQRYHNYDQIVRFLESQQSINHNFVELLHIGRSYEGRPLIIAKISFRNANQIKKKKKTGSRNGILIEAGIHGREWIGPASATWIINELVKIMKSNQTTSETENIRKATWYIMPVLNPDGYTYSQEYDRLWKKSRSKNIVRADGILSTAMKWFQQNTPQKYCYGVDLDKNWDYEWSLKGSSKTACNEFFAGYSAFSEPETKALSKFLLDYRKEIKFFVSLHSYGQIISYPNKVRNSYVAQKLDDLLDVAMVGIDGLRKSGSKTRYKIDSTNDMTISKSGSSDNFAINVAGIPYSFTFNIGDNGVHGFLLPGSYIETISRDTFVIIKSILDYIL